ncbi:transcriptional regulator [Microlunatus endophyticus]|uniref:Transcriptional regulator n=2 Tax=Microlunatus endophyticus TaxID=1716077 RepID=A0A917W426_9ACTN|nr:transcriptional regulator [Microlunatus endophyticus]
MEEYPSLNRTMTELDSVDWEILDILQNDATTPNKEIAARVGVAPSTCLERIRRLRSAGVISAIRAVIDPEAIGRGVQAFLAIQIRPHSRETANDFARQALDLPETIALYNVAGGDDYLVHVAVTDSAALQSLIIDRMLAIQQVAHCRTQLIFGEPWTSVIQRSDSAGPASRRGRRGGSRRRAR